MDELMVSYFLIGPLALKLEQENRWLKVQASQNGGGSRTEFDILPDSLPAHSLESQVFGCV